MRRMLADQDGPMWRSVDGGFIRECRGDGIRGDGFIAGSAVFGAPTAGSRRRDSFGGGGESAQPSVEFLRGGIRERAEIAAGMMKCPHRFVGTSCHPRMRCFNGLLEPAHVGGEVRCGHGGAPGW